jgi:LysR family nitrogen assimilation transcriptional regulator
MELRQLRYYVTVARLASFSRASCQLNVAQSALSRQIRLLEEEFGARLLDRTGRGAMPTAAGEVLLGRAASLLASADELRSLVREPNLVAGEVKLGIPAAFSGATARQILEVCQSKHPGVVVKLREGLSGDLLELLMAARLDLAILYQSQISPVGFVASPIDTRPLALIHSPAIHPLRQRAPTVQQLAELPMVLFERPHGSRLSIDLAFAAAGLKPNITFEVSSFVVLRELLEAGKASTLLPTSDIQAEIDTGRLSATPLGEVTLFRTLCVVRARSAPCSVAARVVFQVLSDHPIAQLS